MECEEPGFLVGKEWVWLCWAHDQPRGDCARGSACSWEECRPGVTATAAFGCWPGRSSLPGGTARGRGCGDILAVGGGDAGVAGAGRRTGDAFAFARAHHRHGGVARGNARGGAVRGRWRGDVLAVGGGDAGVAGAGRRTGDALAFTRAYHRYRGAARGSALSGVARGRTGGSRSSGRARNSGGQGGVGEHEGAREREDCGNVVVEAHRFQHGLFSFQFSAADQSASTMTMNVRLTCFRC